MNENSIHNGSSYHFNFLKDAVVHGFYISEFNSCFSKYPFLMQSHRFDFYSFIFFTKGKGIVNIDNVSYEIKQNRLFILPKNVEHFFRFFENPQGHYTFFCNDFYSNEFSMLRLLYLFSFSFPIANRASVYFIDIPTEENTINSLFETLYNEYSIQSNAKNNSSHIIRSYLNIIILKLIDLLNNQYPVIGSETNAFIIKLSHLVESNFMHQQQGAFYAKSLGITETFLNNLCKKTLNTGLKKLILERRIMEVRKMLEQTDLSIAEISFKFNFSDNSYFNKVFKSHTHLTPGRYREIHKKIFNNS